MDLQRESRRLFPEGRNDSSRRQAVRKVFQAFRGWVSFGRFRSETGTTGIPASALEAGSASSRAIRATAGCAARYSPPSRSSAISRRVADRHQEAPATPEVE